jgi:hypothetical protein
VHLYPPQPAICEKLVVTSDSVGTTMSTRVIRSSRIRSAGPGDFTRSGRFRCATTLRAGRVHIGSLPRLVGDCGGIGGKDYEIQERRREAVGAIPGSKLPIKRGGESAAPPV